MSDAAPATTTVTATAGAATPPTQAVPPRSVGEAVAALIEPQFLLALVLMVVAGRIIDLGHDGVFALASAAPARVRRETRCLTILTGDCWVWHGDLMLLFLDSVCDAFL